MNKLDWRNLSADELESNFNPRIAVPDFASYLEEAQKKASEARKYIPGKIDISYGSHPIQKLDAFYKDKLNNAPIHIFFHGGYWRALDKSDHSHLAIPFVENDCLYFCVNYALCPSVTLSEIYSQVYSSIEWIYKNCSKYGGDPEQITVSGHSAGAHLCALLINENWTKNNLPQNIIKSAFLISGIFEPEVVLKLSLNKEIQLNKQEAINNTPQPKSNIQSNIFISAGDKEPPAWIDQSKKYANKSIEKNNSVSFELLKNHNHFSMLNLLSDPDSLYTKKMVTFTKNA